MRISASWWCNLFHPPPLCSPLPLAGVQQASSYCLLHCNLPSFTAKHNHRLTLFSPHRLFTSAELKWGQAPGDEWGDGWAREQEDYNKNGRVRDRRRRANTKLPSGSDNDVSPRRQLQPEHHKSSRAPAPVPLNATLMLKSLLSQHCEAGLIQLTATLTGHIIWGVRPSFQSGHIKYMACSPAQTHKAFLWRTSDRKVCADFCAPTCSRYSYT